MFVYLKAMPLLIAVTAVNLMSLLDGISTLLLVDDEFCFELNPLVNLLMGHNYLSFFGVKIVMTLVGTLICWHLYERSASARFMLKTVSRIYCLVMIWHGLMLTGWVR